MTKEEYSGNTDSAEAKRKVHLAGMTNKEYSSDADKTKPERNAYVLSPD